MKTIAIYRNHHARCWMADFSLHDEMNDMCRAADLPTAIPMPYTLQADEPTVSAALIENNPGSDIVRVQDLR